MSSVPEWLFSLGVDIAFAISFASVQLFLLYRVLENLPTIMIVLFFPTLPPVKSRNKHD